MLSDTIAAIATPPGSGGIGIVRLSGPEAHSIAARVFRHEGRPPEPRRAVLGRLVDPARRATLDRCLLTLFAAPGSYTGEDAAEFSCHGSPPVLRRLVELLCALGARPAAPGEFTMRAVLNGRADLTQAEAVNRLVRARTLLQAEEAVAQLEGSVSERVRAIDEALLDVAARLEAAVDFAEEDESFIGRREAVEGLEGVSAELESLLDGFSGADLLRDGAVVVIAGGPNAGKSTLFNAILRRERAIVDTAPGTTRDYIAETIEMGGLPLTLVDTAGLRTSGDGVEIEGMRRTEQQLGTADMVLLVSEAAREPSGEELGLLERLKKEGATVIPVGNKSDLLEAETTEGAAGRHPQESIVLSALTGDGVPKLLERIEEELAKRRAGGADRGELITEIRQQQLFRSTAESVGRAVELIAEGAYEELVLEEVRAALAALGEITGVKRPDDILERIFSSFCIGK